MIPNIPMLSEELPNVEHPGRTYKININSNRISGYTNDLDAVIQTVYLILGTERYMFDIYSWDYGVELHNLIGKPMPYVMSEIPRRIKDALITDDRIEDVVDFEFEPEGKTLHVSFTVVTNVGGIPMSMEVAV